MACTARVEGEGNGIRRNVLGARPAYSGHRSCPHHEGDVHVSTRRHRGRRRLACGVRSRQYPYLHHFRYRDHSRRGRGERRLRQRHRRSGECGNLPVPDHARHHGRADQQRRRLCRVRLVGREARQEPHRRPARHLRAGRLALCGRLLQLPDARRGHASRDRRRARLPREAFIHHRCDRSSDLHDRADFLVGRRCVRHGSRPRQRHHGHPAVHPGHSLQLLFAAHHRLRHRPFGHGLRLRSHGEERARSASHGRPGRPGQR